MRPQSPMVAIKSHEIKMKVCHRSARTVGDKKCVPFGSYIMRGDVIPQVRLADVPNVLGRTQNCATQRTELKCSCVQVVKHHLLHLTFNLPSVYHSWSFPISSTHMVPISKLYKLQDSAFFDFTSFEYNCPGPMGRQKRTPLYCRSKNWSLNQIPPCSDAWCRRPDSHTTLPAPIHGSRLFLIPISIIPKPLWKSFPIPTLA